MKPTIQPGTLYSCVKKKRATLFTFLLIVFCTATSNAQTFFGSSGLPFLDNGTQAGPTVAVTPPLLMQAGDLAIIYAHYRGDGAPLVMSQTSGQTWISEATFNGASNQTSFIAWCRFTGTWGADPSVTVGAGLNALTVVMYVFRPSVATNLWAIDIPQVTSNVDATTQTITGVTTTQPKTVTMGFWGSSDDNTWGNINGAGWTQVGSQYRNRSGSDQSHAAAYNIQASPAIIQSVSLDQTLNGSDPTNKSIISWYEYSIPLANDNCAGAVTLTSNISCTNTTGTVVGATNSGIAAPSCGGAPDDDVWYRFTAVLPTTTITLSNLGANLLSSGSRIELFSGICGSLTSLACGTGSITTNTLTPGVQYYVRVYSAGASLAGAGNFNICVTHFTPPANDDCSGVINLTPGAVCAITAGSMNGATISTPVPAGCAVDNLYDVWYSFTATSSNHTIALSGLQASFNRKQIIVYQGTCGGLSVVACSAVSVGTGNFPLAFTDYSPGTTYYVRVIYPNTVLTPITVNGNFNICITTTVVVTSPSIQTGKSYTNITRPNGGVVQNGDVLEFRNVIAVGAWSASGNIYNTTFHDTLPAGLSYVPNSIRFATNEGLPFESGLTGVTSLTDASGDDEAVYSGGVIRVNVGSLPRDGGSALANRQLVYQGSPAVTPITYASAGGGKISPKGRPSQFKSFSLIVVRYQATVTAATGSTFTTSNGAFRYKPTTSNTDDVGFPQTVAAFPRYSIYVSEENTLCQTSVGINTYTLGNFGSGTTRHDSTQTTIAPGYTWAPFNKGAPGDGLFAVVNNTSSNGSTNKYIPTPTTGVGADTARVFNVWDIIGDHTNAANVDSGNFATVPGQTGGYMGVVNAAYGINTAIQKTITGLCGDTYYEFSAWFKNICAACSSDSTGRTATGSPFKSYLGSKTLNDSSGVSPDVTYTIDGVDYYTSGSITYDRRWIKKGFLFKTGPAQTNVTLTIRNNAPGGGGNDWAVDDIGLATCLPSLTMRPSNTPTYCTNGQVDMSVIVNTFYNNYGLYQWERSTDGGGSWTAAPELPGVQSYTYTFNGTSYLDTVVYPTIIATALTNGYKYRIKTATSLTNLSSSSCSVYNTVDVITITVDAGCVVLPVELLQFNAQLKNGYTELKWQSKLEQDLQKYEVERSADGQNFVKIGTVTAKGGNDAQSYTFMDTNPVTGKVYYRLQLVSTQNKKYSNVLSVTGDVSNRFELTNLVNPFNTKISFQVTVPQNEVIEVNLLDAAGKLIYQTKMNVNKGINALNFEAPSQVQKGNYLLRVVSKEGVVNKVIQKH